MVGGPRAFLVRLRGEFDSRIRLQSVRGVQRQRQTLKLTVRVRFPPGALGVLAETVLKRPVEARKTQVRLL